MNKLIHIESDEEKITRLESELSTYEEKKLNVITWKAVTFGFFLFVVFLTIMGECERRDKVLLNGQIVTYKWRIDSLENVVKCKDIFIEENTFFKNLTNREKEERAEMWTKKRHEAGIFIE